MQRVSNYKLIEGLVPCHDVYRRLEGFTLFAWNWEGRG
jgi:hypothetical protein